MIPLPTGGVYVYELGVSAAVVGICGAGGGGGKGLEDGEVSEPVDGEGGRGMGIDAFFFRSRILSL